MNVSQVLDTAIGTLLFLVIFSAAASAGLEAVLAVTRARNEALNHQLVAMLGPLDGTVRQAIVGLSLGGAGAAGSGAVVPRGVEFLSPSVFADAVIESLRSGSATPNSATSLSAALGSRLGHDVDAISLDNLRKALEDWFRDNMSQLTARFRANSFKQLAIAGALVALLGNASVLTVASTLWSSDAVRTVAIDAASKMSAPPIASATAGVSTPPPVTPSPRVSSTPTVKSNATPRATPSAVAVPAERLADGSLDQFLEQFSKLGVLQLPVGWKSYQHFVQTITSPASLFSLLAGALLTGLLTGMGSQYWFDLMKKLLSLRRFTQSGADRAAGASTGGDSQVRLVALTGPPTAEGDLDANLRDGLHGLYGPSTTPTQSTSS